MECARRDPTARRRRRTCESGAKGQSSSSLCSELGCVTCHVDGSVSTRTSVGRSVVRACVCVCVCVSSIDGWIDRLATCVPARVGVARHECAGSDERGGRTAVWPSQSLHPRRTKHVCAKLFQNDFPPNSSSSLEVTRAKDVAHTAPTTARSLGERTTRERVSGTPFFSAAPRLLQWTAHRSTGRWLRQALQPSRLLLVPRTNLRSRRPAPSSNNRIQGLLRQQQLLISNLLDQQLLVVNPQDQ